MEPRLHAIAAGASVTLVVLLAVLGVHLRGTRQEAALTKALATCVTVSGVYSAIYYLIPSRFDWSVSLPLHVCDLLPFIAGVAIGNGNRSMRALLFFVSLPLASQAIISPVGEHNYLSSRFWLYWSTHALILTAAIYDYFALRFSPTFQDLLRVFAVQLLYVGILFPVNLHFGWNYGYIGSTKPADTTALDHFGPWPQRVLSIIALVFLLQLLLWLLFGRRRTVQA